MANILSRIGRNITDFFGGVIGGKKGANAASTAVNNLGSKIGGEIPVTQQNRLAKNLLVSAEENNIRSAFGTIGDKNILERGRSSKFFDDLREASVNRNNLSSFYETPLSTLGELRTSNLRKAVDAGATVDLNNFITSNRENVLSGLDDAASLDSAAKKTVTDYLDNIENNLSAMTKKTQIYTVNPSPLNTALREAGEEVDANIRAYNAVPVDTVQKMRTTLSNAAEELSSSTSDDSKRLAGRYIRNLRDNLDKEIDKSVSSVMTGKQMKDATVAAMKQSSVPKNMLKKISDIPEADFSPTTITSLMSEYMWAKDLDTYLKGRLPARSSTSAISKIPGADQLLSFVQRRADDAIGGAKRAIGNRMIGSASGSGGGQAGRALGSVIGSKPAMLGYGLLGASLLGGGGESSQEEQDTSSIGNTIGGNYVIGSNGNVIGSNAGNLTRRPSGTIGSSLGTSASGVSQSGTLKINGRTQEEYENALVRAAMAGDKASVALLQQVLDIFNNRNKSSSSGMDLTSTQQNRIIGLQNAYDSLESLEDAFNSAGGGKGRIAGNTDNFMGTVGLNSNASVYNAAATTLINTLKDAIGKTDAANTDPEVQRLMSMVPNISDNRDEGEKKLTRLRNYIETTYANTLGTYSGNYSLTGGIQ